MASRVARGFTLLEVLVAIAILGLGLTVILSSQVGLFANASRIANLTVATNLARCKMSEVEVKLAKDGFSLLDQTDSGACCADGEEREFRCTWKIERVELPEPGSLELGDGGETDEEDSLGPFAALAELEEASKSGAAGPEALSGIAENLGSASTTAGMGPMVMGMVYPDLKPMLEASIRKVTVSVLWDEGKNERDLSVTQYITDPQQGGFEAAEEGEDLADPDAPAAVPTPGLLRGLTR